jgi:glucokinase
VILAGDIGGTKCNLALFEENSGRLQVVLERRFESKKYPEFRPVVAEFLQLVRASGAPREITAAVFGVAGPVLQNHVKVANLPWEIDGTALVERIGVPKVVLINDLAATANSLPHLPQEDFCSVNKGEAVPGGAIALVGAGTGWGHVNLIWDGNRYCAAVAESAHADFSPHDEQQLELLRFVLRRGLAPSTEAILSGSGLGLVHEFLAPQTRHDFMVVPGADVAPEISRLGLGGSCPACVETLDLWTKIYGSEAGNAALRALATGGVYLCGGIAVKILPKMTDGRFVRAFRDKAKMEYLLERMPVSVVLNEKAPLIGAAYGALEVSRTPTPA